MRCGVASAVRSVALGSSALSLAKTCGSDGGGRPRDGIDVPRWRVEVT